MQGELRDKNDVKIFILYLLRHVGYPIDFASVNDIVLQDGIVGYFDFAHCFNELIETGNIDEITENGKLLYKISEQGISVADSLSSEIIAYIREKSLKSAMRVLDFERKGWTTKQSYVPLDDGRFKYTCTILEHKKELVSITVVLDSQKTLEKMMYNFRQRPEVVYRGLFTVLTGEINYLL